MEQSTEGPLVLRILIDIRNAQLRLPKEGMIGAFEYLPLLRNGAYDRFQRGAPVDVAESSGLDLLDHLRNAPPDRSKILESLVPEKPTSIG
ncbi:hypothetical protein, partial [Escherichia coli]|uniref:hypothetical protein n=1 Tax=Escherichia coli TaxID=562 RepID=UPI001BE3F85F